MDFVAYPCQAPLLAVMSLFVIGRANVTRWRGNIFRRTPTNGIIDPLVILYPHLSQDFHSRNLAEPLRGVWLKKSIKQLSSLFSDFFSKGEACRFPQRRTRIFASRTITFHPLLFAVSTEPVGSSYRKTIEGSTHRFPDTEHSVEGADLGQDMGGIGALPSARFEPAFLPKHAEHFLKQKLLSMVFYETSTKFGEDRGVKPCIGEFQTQQILPIDPPSNGISRLSIRKVLYKLHHSNQG